MGYTFYFFFFNFKAGEKKIASTEDCLQTENGADYKGTKAEDERGYPCKDWSLTEIAEVMSPADKNYCRNPYPDTGKKPWCYLVTGGRWGYCDIPMCGELILHQLHLLQRLLKN